MTDKSWNKMTTDEKLDWLRARIDDLAGGSRQNLVNEINRVVGALDQRIKKLADDVSDLKKRMGKAG